MGVGDVDESFQCPCCIECKECKDFQKVAEIKDAGLVIFRHLVNSDDDVNKHTEEVLQPAVSPIEDVFILQNTRNVDIPSGNFVPNFETFKISCRRCRTIYERAQKLLKRVPIIGENHVIGICDHCYQKQYPKSCNECEKVVNKFLAARHGGRDTEDVLKTTLINMEQVLKNVRGDGVKTVKPTNSDLYIDKTSLLDSRPPEKLKERDNVVKTVKATNFDLYIDKTSLVDSRPPGKLKERDNVMLGLEIRRSDTKIPGSLQNKPKYDKHGDLSERLLVLGKSDGFIESMGAQHKYHPDQKQKGESLEPARREQSEFRATTQRSIFEEPNKILNEMRYSNFQPPLFHRTQGRNKNIEMPLHTVGKSSGFLDPMGTQKSRPVDQRHTEADIDMGKPAHSTLGSSQPRSIFGEADRTKEIKMRDSNISTPHLYKSKRATDKNIKSPLQELGKSIEFKDSMKSLKKHRTNQRYKLEAADSKQKGTAFEDSTVRPLFDEDSSIRPLLDKVLHKSPTQKHKKRDPHKRSETTVFSDKQGLRIANKQSSKSVIKKTGPIGTRVKKHTSKETLVSTISRAVQNTLGKELSYFFPLVDVSGKTQKNQSSATSAALIQDTKKKLQEEKIRKEAEKKVELEKKKYLAEEKAKVVAEKKRLAAEKKRIADEDEKKRHAEEKKRIADEDEKKKQTEESDKKSRTKEYDKTQNLADAKRHDKAKDIDNIEKGKRRTGNNKRDKSSSPVEKKIKGDAGRGDFEKSKDIKLERGDKKTNDEENEKLALERLKKEKEYKQEEKERLKKEKEEKLQQEKNEKERLKKEKDEKLQQERNEKEKLKKEKDEKLQQERNEKERLRNDKEEKLQQERNEKERLKKEKDEKLQQERNEQQREKERKEADKYKIAEEKELKSKEKNKVLEDKKEKETKYTDDMNVIKEKDLNLKGKQTKDTQSNEDDLKQKDDYKSDKKVFDSKDSRENEPRDQDKQKRDRLKQATEGTNFQEKDDRPNMKKSTKNESQLGESSKDVKVTENEKENKNRQAIQQMMTNKDKSAELNNTPTAKEQLAEAKKQKPLDTENKLDTRKGKTQPSNALEALKTGQKELNFNQIKTLKQEDDLILQLVKVKQENLVPRNRNEASRIDPLIIAEHKKHAVFPKLPTCVICVDSNLELEIESIELEKTKPKWSDIIKGEKIMKFMPPFRTTMEEQEPGVMPSVFKAIFNVDAAQMPIPLQKIVQIAPGEDNAAEAITVTAKSGKQPTDPELTKGIMRYALSDRAFIDKGWTMLPTEKVVRKMNVYRMRPAQPEFDWFEHNKNKRLMLYDSGERLAEFDDNGRGRWYYKNGHLALDYYDAEEINASQRFVVYSNGEPDERGRSRPITILATFDYAGNGVVFDHTGKIRLKYNQTEGVVLDRGIGPVSHWKWHTLNDPPVLQQVMIDTQMAHKDPQIIKLGATSDKKPRTDNDEMLAIEFDNFIKEKSKKLTQSFKPFQIKMKALKINEHFSLKVLDQATVYLIYREGSTNLKINIGMILDHKEIVDTDTAEVGEVSNSLERFPARTESIAMMQRSVAYAERFERNRTERERRLRPAEPCSSADRLTAAAARPRPPVLKTVPTGSASGSGCYCNLRKPSSCQVYYNTRLT